MTMLVLVSLCRNTSSRGLTSPCMAYCPEYRAIRKCSHKLVETISLNIDSISQQLFSDAFISEPASKRVRAVTGIDSENKAGDLVTHILYQISLNKERYYEFIKILRTDMSQDGMIELLESTRQSNMLSTPLIDIIIIVEIIILVL